MVCILHVYCMYPKGILHMPPLYTPIPFSRQVGMNWVGFVTPPTTFTAGIRQEYTKMINLLYIGNTCGIRVPGRTVSWTCT